MIARPRKRPRDKSVSFRTFWWLLRMEASLRIAGNVLGTTNLMTHRWDLYRQDHRTVFRHARTLLALDRGARYWP